MPSPQEIRRSELASRTYKSRECVPVGCNPNASRADPSSQSLRKQKAIEEQRQAFRDARTAFERARVNLDQARKKRDYIQNLPSEDEKRKEHTEKMARMARQRLQGARRLTVRRLLLFAIDKTSSGQG